MNCSQLLFTGIDTFVSRCEFNKDEQNIHIALLFIKVILSSLSRIVVKKVTSCELVTTIFSRFLVVTGAI
jgi:hypothetical protein